MYGWEPDETVTLPMILAHVYPGDAERVSASVRRAHEPDGDGKFDIEHRIVDRRGAVRWVQTRAQTLFAEISGEVRASRTIGGVQGVTERRRADELRRVLDAIAIADPSGALIFANEEMHRLWGYTHADSLLGRSVFDFWQAGEQPEAALERIKRERARTLEMRATRVDGTSFYVEVTAEAVCDAVGKLTQLLVTFTDITRRKELEAQLNHAQKIDSIGRLAGGIAHDFNNMLTVILGGIELTLPTLPTSGLTRGYLQDAAEAGQSAAALTRQLLAFSRKEAIAPRALI